jgi:dihydropteroate synthase
MSAREHIHFITGRLAEFSLRAVLDDLAPRAGFDYSIHVLGITVAALMTPEWIARKLAQQSPPVPPETTRVMVPGYCHGSLAAITELTGRPVECGPKDLRDLPTHFGRARLDAANYGEHDIQIVAEINHAPRLTLAEILQQAERLQRDGADLIDVGCDPGQTWSGVADVVRALKDRGHRVSIDSLNPAEIAPAVRAGAELVLSVNSSNREAAVDWGVEVIVVPDFPAGLVGLDETVEFLATRNVRLRIDPILEPIGFGFAHSLGRYLQARERYPDAEMLMGIGNLTELTDVDSAGVNVMLLGFCAEIGIRSVLTTQVINWARSSVKECDLARRLVHYSRQQRALPKHIEPRLVMLRDARLLEHGDDALDRLSHEIKDPNYRIFAEGDQLHVVSAGLHLKGADPFALFTQLQGMNRDNLDAGHSFYLGYELAKAVTALTLSKHYRQDQALNWGFLTRPESTAGHNSRVTRAATPVDSPIAASQPTLDDTEPRS